MARLAQHGHSKEVTNIGGNKQPRGGATQPEESQLSKAKNKNKKTRNQKPAPTEKKNKKTRKPKKPKYNKKMNPRNQKAGGKSPSLTIGNVEDTLSQTTEAAL